MSAVEKNLKLIEEAEMKKDGCVFFMSNGIPALYKITPEEKALINKIKNSVDKKLEPTFYDV